MSQPDVSAVSPAGTSPSWAEEGFAARFERRPEFLFFNLPVQDVVDASVRERTVDDLKVFHIPHVFAGKDEIFLGFGKPNAYLTVPDGEGGYQKFAGKSLKRAPSAIAATKNFVQSGILFRFRNLPPSAAGALREAMKKHHGIKYWTCVNACLRVMEDAGFTSGARKLSSIYFPYALMKTLLRSGLEFEGKKVEFQIVRTSPEPLEKYTRGIIAAELSTFRRHFMRAVDGRARGSKFFAGVSWLLHAPGRATEALFGGRSSAWTKPVVAPELPAGEDYRRDVKVSISRPSILGTFLRQMWGSHALFEARVDRVNMSDYLTRPLKPFPQPNPSLLTRVKKRVLFSPPVIWLMRKMLAPSYVELGTTDERHVYDMMRTNSDSKKNIYNLVITGPAQGSSRRGVRIIISRISVGMKLVDWVLSKHVLISGYDPEIVLKDEGGEKIKHVVGFAGETYKDAEGVFHVTRNSGTFQPTEEEQQMAVACLQEAFPHWRFVADKSGA